MTHRTSSRVLLIVAAFALFLVPVAAIAAGDFTDVDDDSVFKTDIQWLADAGVTKGCNPPTNDKFCPESNVTREQMAAFMHRLAANKVVDAKTAMDADNLDGMDSTAFAVSGHNHDADYLAVDGKATDSDKLDGMDSTAFAVSGHNHDADYLAVDGKATDSDKLDGMDSTAFLGKTEKAADSDLLDGLDSTDFYTRAEVDAKIPGGVVIAGSVLQGDQTTDIIRVSVACVSGSATNTSVYGSVTLPLGVRLTGMTARWIDTSSDNAQIELWRISADGSAANGIGTVMTSGTAGHGSTSVSLDETVDSGEAFVVSYLFGSGLPVTEAAFCGLEISYDAG